jgi:hypothetical protein
MRVKGRLPVVVAASIAWLGTVGIPAAWLSSDRYSAYVAALQAGGLAVAFVLGWLSYSADAKDRRVDRVYALHQELTGGELDKARRRLGRHLRQPSGILPQWCRLSRKEMRDNPSLNSYADTNAAAESTPFRDAGLLLRFFERAWVVQVAGSAHESTFVELVGRHASWWNCVFINDGLSAREPLMSLGMWADAYAAAHSSRQPSLQRWTQGRIKDFGSLFPWERD